ncbi:monoamine oxidase [Peribacillus deserti]|uniref:Monoamine oxidase n=1 Tax=Peribacillus deserti TaxID=673318 RepID=A0ABS2QEE4_9BACI|nr:flavin monoamine oxidase family protein [Peribacillus deserti]MBM7691467.1 monoamine oxidase [Peribacillus deserti]
MIYGIASQTLRQMINMIRSGLPKTNNPKKIIIAGAGIAGLVAASLLKKAGHFVNLIEGSNRVGGRILTLREPFIEDQYMEAGPMRIPSVHHLTLEYLNKFRLPVSEFINSTPYDLYYVNGVKTRLKYILRNPDILRFPVAEWEKGKAPLDLLKIVTKPIQEYLSEDSEKSWSNLEKQFDKYSLEFFLRYNPVERSLSSGAVEMLKVLLSLEGFPHLSFLQIYRELQYLLEPNMKFYEIAGGFDKLPNAFLPELTENIHFKQKVKKIVHDREQIHIHTCHTESSVPYEFKGDLAIITIPFSSFQQVEVVPQSMFSYHKWRAIRELHYVPATKIGLQFKRRFWEENGLLGGQSVTDLPIRFSYYPSSGIGTKTGGIIIASYTWEDDTLPWDSLIEEDRIKQALENLAVLYGKKIYQEFIAGASYSWSQNPYSSGGFSLFRPEQATTIGPYISNPENRIHFAGEHTSHFPAWIQGGIESGIRVAMEVNNLP